MNNQSITLSKTLQIFNHYPNYTNNQIVDSKILALYMFGYKYCWDYFDLSSDDAILVIPYKHTSSLGGGVSYLLSHLVTKARPYGSGKTYRFLNCSYKKLKPLFNSFIQTFFYIFYT